VNYRDPFSPAALVSGTVGVPSRTVTKIAPKVAPNCARYLEQAPANNFFHNHNYVDVERHFPKQNYTMPNFAGGWGYQPERTPYLPYNDYQFRVTNKHCANTPQSCWNTRSTGSKCTGR
jgi:hypothetical protein